MSSVFLCHSHTDKSFARRLAADLRLAGHAVWIDEAEISVGDSLILKIRDGLNQVDYVAAIISNASIGSPWVNRELDVASNREMKENRVLVLPLLLEKVPMPGFLEGKFYGDFTDPTRYSASFKLLLQKLGAADALPRPSAEELVRLQDELKRAQAAAALHESGIRAHETLALRGKSPRLVAAIKEANAKFPSHAPINATYAIELGDIPLTLDYLLWAISKSDRRGGHPVEILISLEGKWAEVTSMLQAYADLLKASNG